jgi:hypothetical protein
MRFILPLMKNLYSQNEILVNILQEISISKIQFYLSLDM